MIAINWIYKKSRSLKRCKQFHDISNNNEAEDSSKQELQEQENPQKVANGWLNISEDVEWLEGWVKAGYGWTATHFIDKHRQSREQLW